MKKKYFFIAALALAIAAGAWWYLRGKDTEQRFTEIPVKKGSIAVTILATGTVQPENRVEIKPPINGRVETVLVKEGDKVKKGQVLAQMSSTERAALIDAARAKGKGELKQWEEMYKPTPILAPITGTIIQRNVESGQSFTSVDPVLVMSDVLTVKAQVDETDISQIKVNQKATIVLDAYSSEKFPAKVDQIAYDAKTVNNVTTYIVDVLPNKVPEFMRSGMTANVTFEVLGKEDILVIPAEAIRTNGGETTVWASDGKAPRAKRTIQTGISDGKVMEIVSGLSEDDIVYVPQFRMGDKKNAGGSPFAPNRPGGQRRAGAGGGGGGGH